MAHPLWQPALENKTSHMTESQGYGLLRNRSAAPDLVGAMATNEVTIFCTRKDRLRIPGETIRMRCNLHNLFF